jgi:hypothetical protein
MANLWYKVAEYSNLSGRHQQLDPNLWVLLKYNRTDAEKHHENYWKNLSSMGRDNTVAYSADIKDSHFPYKALIHRTCLPEVEKNDFRDKVSGLKYSNLKPVSFQELRQEQNNDYSPIYKAGADNIFPQCLNCATTILPSRPHSEKECKPNGRPQKKGNCLATCQLRPEGIYFHKCQHGSYEGSCINHGGFDPKHAFPQGHITDEQVKAYGTSGDLEVLLGSEAEYRVKNNLPINLGGRNKS